MTTTTKPVVPANGHTGRIVTASPREQRTLAQLRWIAQCRLGRKTSQATKDIAGEPDRWEWIRFRRVPVWEEIL